MTRTTNLSFLSVAVSYEELKRDVRSDKHDIAVLRGHDVLAQLSVDLLDIVTLTGGAGYVQAKPHKYFGYEEKGLMWMGGARATLWTHTIEDPTFLACQLRLDTAISYWEYESQYLGYDLTWDEIRGQVTVSAELYVQDGGRDLSVYPYSIVFQTGAVYSRLDGDSGTPFAEVDGIPGTPATFSESEPWGVLVGVDLYLAHNFSISGEARLHTGSTYLLGAAYHF